MIKYHIAKDGKPGKCTAENKCPYGDLEADHYATAEEAQSAFEAKNKEIIFKELRQNILYKDPAEVRLNNALIRERVLKLFEQIPQGERIRELEEEQYTPEFRKWVIHPDIYKSLSQEDLEWIARNILLKKEDSKKDINVKGIGTGYIEVYVPPDYF